MTHPTDFHALVLKMADELDHYRQLLTDDHSERHALATEARATLAQQKPEGPTIEELGLIYHDSCRGCEFMDQGGFEDGALAVLSRWGCPPAPPAEGEGPSDDCLDLVVIAIQALHSPAVTPTLNLEAVDQGRKILREQLARWGRPAAPPPAEGVAAELVAENRKLRSAGCNLAEAAIRVAQEYDGVHRLMLTVSEWAKTVADEGGRGEAVAHALPLPTITTEKTYG